MDPKLIYWTAALLNFGIIVTATLLGWRRIRSGDVEGHRKAMNIAIALVGVFLLSYVFKVIFLGKEQLELWSPQAVMILRIHETIVLVMVVAGTAARILARRLAPQAPEGDPEEALKRRHRRSGKVAVISSAFALLTAAMVLFGMYLRA